MRAAALLACVSLAACSGLAWNTKVANTPQAREAMAAAVVPGTTTERQLVTRWGYPTQKVREGGQTEYIYRDMTNLPGWYFPQFGDSHRYVIVTFQYGIATAVRTSDGIDCRATFPPRPPGTVVDNPTTVRLVGSCAPLLTPEEAARKGPIGTAWDKLTQSGDTAGPAPQSPGVIEDSYDPSGKAGRRAGVTSTAPRGEILAQPAVPAAPEGEIIVPILPGPATAPSAAGRCADAMIRRAEGDIDCATER